MGPVYDVLKRLRSYAKANTLYTSIPDSSNPDTEKREVYVQSPNHAKLESLLQKDCASPQFRRESATERV